MIHDALGAFTAAECDAIIALRTAEATAPAPVWDGAGYDVQAETRRVSAALPPRGPATAWLYDRLDALFATAATVLGLPVGPLVEPVQILRYDPGCHYQVWHTDSGADLGAQRQISVSVELSDAADYEGGDLQIVPAAMAGRAGLPRGSARFFASRALHRVTPVTRGVRHALVIWAPAPQFTMASSRS